MKNKKKLLVTVGVMGLMAIATGGVGTAAWFQATASGKMHSAAYDGTVSVQDPGYEASSVDLPLKVTVTREESPAGTLELASYFSTAPSNRLDGSGSSAGLFAGYWDENSTQVYYTDQPKTSDHTLYAVFAVKVSIDEDVAGDGSWGADHKYTDSLGTVWTKEQLAAKLSNSEVDVDIARAEDKYVLTSDATAVKGVKYYSRTGEAPYVYTEVANVVVGTTDVSAYYEHIVSRAKFFDLDPANAPAVTEGATSLTNNDNDADASDGDYSITLGTINANGTATTIAKFGLYVEGIPEVPSNIDQGRVAADFTVTVAGL